MADPSTRQTEYLRLKYPNTGLIPDDKQIIQQMNDLEKWLAYSVNIGTVLVDAGDLNTYLTWNGSQLTVNGNIRLYVSATGGVITLGPTSLAVSPSQLAYVDVGSASPNPWWRGTGMWAANGIFTADMSTYEPNERRIPLLVYDGSMPGEIAFLLRTTSRTISFP